MGLAYLSMYYLYTSCVALVSNNEEWLWWWRGEVVSSNDVMVVEIIFV